MIPDCSFFPLALHPAVTLMPTASPMPFRVALVFKARTSDVFDNMIHQNFNRILSYLFLETPVCYRSHLKFFLRRNSQA